MSRCKFGETTRKGSRDTNSGVPTMFWEIGYSCGTFGMSWVSTVGGQFLSQQQRRDMYNGWIAGLKDQRTYWQDMETVNWEEIPV